MVIQMKLKAELKAEIMSHRQNSATIYGLSPRNKKIVQSPQPRDIGKFTNLKKKKRERERERENTVKRSKSIKRAERQVT